MLQCCSAVANYGSQWVQLQQLQHLTVMWVLVLCCAVTVSNSNGYGPYVDILYIEYRHDQTTPGTRPV